MYIYMCVCVCIAALNIQENERPSVELSSLAHMCHVSNTYSLQTESWPYVSKISLCKLRGYHQYIILHMFMDGFHEIDDSLCISRL